MARIVIFILAAFTPAIICLFYAWRANLDERAQYGRAVWRARILTIGVCLATLSQLLLLSFLLQGFPRGQTVVCRAGTIIMGSRELGSSKRLGVRCKLCRDWARKGKNSACALDRDRTYNRMVRLSHGLRLLIEIRSSSLRWQEWVSWHWPGAAPFGL